MERTVEALRKKYEGCEERWRAEERKQDKIHMEFCKRVRDTMKQRYLKNGDEESLYFAKAFNEHYQFAKKQWNQ